MKKFSKLITESKKELWTKHPLVNPVDWDEVFKPLVEHINENLKANVPPPGEGVFGSNTKDALDALIDAITEDYVEYYANVIDDGSQDSFFSAYNINIDWNDLMDCLQPIMDRTEDVDDYPNWDGGYWFMNLNNLKFENTDELLEDILDISGKLKMFKIDYNIEIQSKNSNTFRFNKYSSEDKISKGIKNLLELPGEEPKRWVTGLKSISIFIFNKDTVQVGDLD